MQNKGSTAFVIGLVFVLVAFFAKPLQAQMTGVDDASIQSRIAAAIAQPAFDARTLALDDLLNNAMSSGQTYQDATKSAFFNALQLLFNNRLEQKYKVPTQTLPVEVMNLLFSSATDSNLLTPAQADQVGNFLDTTMLEELIFDLQTQTDYMQQLSTLRAILSKAANKTFVVDVQKIFFANLTMVFNQRAGADKTTLRPVSQVAMLKAQLTTATTTPLLTPADQATVRTYVAIITVEQDILTVPTLTDYGAQIDKLASIASANAGNTFPDVTQNIYFLTVKNVFEARTAIPPATALANKISSRLYTFLTSIVTSPLLNTTVHQPTIRTYIAMLEIEKNIEAIAAMTDYNAQLGALQAVIALAQGRTVTPATQNLFDGVLRTIFDARPRKDLATLQKLLGLLTTNVVTSNLESDAQKNNVRTVMIPAVQADILALQRLDLIVPPPTNTTPIPQLGNSNRLNELGKILTDNAGKPLDPATEGKVFNALQRAFDTRAMNPTELANLMKLLNDWVNSGLLSPDHANMIKNQWLPRLNTDQNLLKLDTLTDPASIISSLDPSQFTGPLDANTQDRIFAALQRAFNNRQPDINLLTQLKNLFQAWIDKNLLKPAQNDALRGWIAILNGEIAALQLKTQLADTARKPADQQIGDLGKLLNDALASGKPLDPATQDQVFAMLQNLYNNRVQQLDPLKALKDLLTRWLQSNLLKPAQNNVISTVWLPQINRELAAFQAQQQLAQLNPTTVTPQSMNDLLNNLQNVQLSPEGQDKIFGLLKALYDQRKPVVAELQNLQQILTAWANSNKLKPDQTAVIRGTWLPTIARELQLLTAQQQVQNILAQPIDPTKGINDAVGPLNNMLNQFGNQPTNPDTQKQLFDTLNQLLNKADPNNPNDQKQLQDLLNKWGASPLLSPDQQNVLKNNLLPTVNNNLAALQQKGALDRLAALPDNNSLIDGLDKFLTDNAGKPLDPATEARVFEMLQKAYNNRRKTIPELTKLVDLLTKWLNSNLLAAEHNNIIRTQWLPTLANELNTLVLMQQIAAALAQKDYMAKLAALQNIMGTAQGMPFMDDAKTAFYNALVQVFNQRPTLAQALNALQQLLNNALGSNLLTDDQKARVRDEMLAALTAALNATQLKNDLQSALAQPNYNDKLNALNNALGNMGNQPPNPDLQNLFANALQQLFNNRPQDPDALNKLMQLLQGAQGSNLLADAQKAVVQNSMIPTAQAGQQLADIEGMIRAAMALADYLAKLDALSQIMDKAQGGQFGGSTQNLFASAITQVFGDRVKQQTLDTLKKLSDVLTKALTTPLLSAAQQQYVKNMLDTLAVEIAINSALQQSDYGAQLDALLDMVFAYSQIRLVDPRVQDLFFEALKRVLSNRASQYAPSVQDDTNIDKLALLIVNASDSTLLSASQQKVISAYSDTLDFEQIIVDASRMTNYSVQVNTALRIVRSETDKTYFDSITNTVYFNLLKMLFDNRGAAQPAQIEVLKQTLTMAVSSPLLNFEQQQYVKTVMLPALGVSAPATTPFEQNLANILKLPDMQARINGLLQLQTQMAGQTITPAMQAAYMGAIKQLMGSADPSDPTSAALLNRLLSGVQASPLVGGSDQSFIRTTVLPTLQPSSTGLPPSLPSVSTPPGAVVKPATIALPTLPGAPGAPSLGVTGAPGAPGLDLSGLLGQLIPSLVPTPTTLQAASRVPQPSARIEMLASLIGNAQGQTITPEMQQALLALINQLLAQQNQLDPATLAKLLQLIQQAQASPLASPQYQAALAGAVPTLTGAVTQAITPNAQTITKATQIADPSARIDALGMLMDNAAGGTINAKTQNLLAAALDKLAKDSAGFDPVTLAKLAALLQKAQSSPLLAPAQQNYIQQTLAPRVTDQATKAATPSVGSLRQAFAQRDPNTQLDALNMLMDNAAQAPLDQATTNEFARILDALAKAGPSMDPLAQSKLLNLLQKAQSTLQLPPAMQQKLAQAANKIAQVLTPGLAAPDVTAPDLGVVPGAPAPGKKVAGAKKAAVPTADLQPTVANIQKAATQKAPSTKLDQLEQMLANAAGKTFDVKTQNAFAQAIDKLAKDSVNADAGTLARVNKLLQDAATSPLLGASQQQYVQGTLLPAIGQALAQATQPTAAAVQKIAAQKDPKLQVDALAALVANAAGQPVDAQTQAAAGALVDKLIAQHGKLDQPTRAKLAQVLQDLQATQLLTPDKQQVAANAAAALAAGVAPEVAVPDTGVVSGAPAPGKKVAGVKKAAAPTPDLQPTVANIQKAAAQKMPSNKLDQLEQMLANAAGKTFDVQTQNEFAQAIDQLAKDSVNADAGTLARVNKLLQAAATSPLLGAPQQQYVQNTLLPAVSQALAQATQPTTDAVQKIAAQKDLKLQVEALAALAANAIGQPVDAATQAAAGALVDKLLAQQNKMDQPTRDKLVQALNDIQSGQLLTPDKQQAAAAAAANIAAAPAKVAGKAAEKAAAVGIKKAAAPTPDLQPTVANIQKAAAQKMPSNKLDQLEQILANAAGKTFDVKTQNEFAQALDKLAKDSVNADAGTLARVNKLLQDAATSPLLGAPQQQYVQSTLLPAVTQALAQASQPTADALQKATAQTDPKLQVDALAAIVANAAGQPVDAATQAAAGALVDKLIAQQSKLDQPTRDKLAQLLQDIQATQLLTPDKQQAAAAAAATIAATPAAPAKVAEGKAAVKAAEKAAVKAAEKVPVAGKLAEAKPADAKAAVVKAAEVKPAEVKPAAPAVKPAAPSKPSVRPTAHEGKRHVEKTRVTQAPVIKSAMIAFMGDYNKLMSAIKQAAKFADQMSALQKLTDWARTRAVPDQQQQEIVALVKDLASKRPTDAAATTLMQDTLNRMLATAILNNANKADINTNVVATLKAAPAAAAPTTTPTPPATPAAKTAATK